MGEFEQNESDSLKEDVLVSTHVRIRKSVHDVIKEVAHDHYKSQGEVIRSALENNLAEYLGQVVYVEPEQGEAIKQEITELQNTLTGIYTELHRIGVNYNQQTRMKNMIANYNRNVKKVQNSSLSDAEKKDRLEYLKNQHIENKKKIINSTLPADMDVMEKMLLEFKDATKEAGEALWRILE